ncbi:MAG TPA: serine hydrolase [Pyrinomonadaceae bacterium]|nr:serine hydrolase [Pyrinomonadaceae bacterium]
MGERIDEYFTSIAASDFSGVLLVVKNEQVIVSKGYGAANTARRIPFTDKTVFDIGSITKQFTSAAILKLEMQGRLRVADPLSRFIAGVPPDKAAITIHHLLTHSAGFANNLRRYTQARSYSSTAGMKNRPYGRVQQMADARRAERAVRNTRRG